MGCHAGTRSDIVDLNLLPSKIIEATSANGSAVSAALCIALDSARPIERRMRSCGVCLEARSECVRVAKCGHGFDHSWSQERVVVASG